MRFNLAVAFTIVVVAYVLVPAVNHFLESAAGYNPAYYEPKDSTRLSWLLERGPLSFTGLTPDTIINLSLILALGLVWFTIMRSRR